MIIAGKRAGNSSAYYFHSNIFHFNFLATFSESEITGGYQANATSCVAYPFLIFVDGHI